MSFSLGTSRNPAIIVARTPVSRAQFKTLAQVRADESAARSARRQASYASNRLVAIPRGVPMYAVGRGQMARGEVKFFDLTIASPVTTGPYGLQMTSAPPSGAEPSTAFAGITELNCVEQGATSYNRIGTKILIKSIMFQACFSLAGTVAANDLVRYMLVYDHQPNGAFPALSTILSANIGTAPTFYGAINMANRSRFIILRDRIQAIDSDGGNGAMISVKEFVKCKLETQFKSSTSSIGDITTGAIYLVAFALSSSANTYVQMSAGSCRIRYFD